MAAAADTSRPLVGSSATIRKSGSSASARAIPTRRAWPPESSCGYLRRLLGRELDHVEQFIDECCSPCGTRLIWYGSVRRYADPQRGLRLEYGSWKIICARRRSGAAGGAQRCDILPVEHDAAGSDRSEAEDRSAERRLAGAGLADQADDLPAAQVEIDVVDRAHRRAAAAGDASEESAAVVEVGAQRFDAHERVVADGRCRRARLRADCLHGALGHDACRDHPAARDRVMRVEARLVVDVALHAAASGSARSRGASRTQTSWACGQRGWNAQPDGSAERLGTRPGIVASRSPRWRARGHRGEERLRVGMTRCAEDLIDGPFSTARPAYMTTTRSHSCEIDAEVVRDEQDGRAVARHAAAAAARRSAPRA